MKQTQNNPTCNKSFSITTYSFSATGASGTITGTGVAALEKGQSIFLGLAGSSAQGYTKNGEYFVIPVGATSFKIASTKANALAGISILTASGNAGGGTIYPNYLVGGVLFVGSSGNVNIRGIQNMETGTSSFSVHKNISDGSMLPMMIKDISSSGTTANDFITWSN
jgi:hypothetical protein